MNTLDKCYQCGKPVAADSKEAVRFEQTELQRKYGYLPPVYCDRECFAARHAEMERKRNWEVSVHETGHILGTRLAGEKIFVATVEPEGLKTEGHCRTTTVGWEDRIIEYLLGHAAELEFGIDNDGYDHDYRQAVKLLKDHLKIRKHGIKDALKSSRWQFPSHYLWREHQRKLRMTKGEWKAKFDRLRRKARRLARKHRDWIERVAALLVERRTLTDKEIPPL